MFRLWSSEELFRHAEARVLGAQGYGFAVANQIESKLDLHGGGSGLVHLDPRADLALAAARLITLCDGVVQIRPHVEELFQVLLYVVSPRGGHDVLLFRCGGGGLTFQQGFQLASDAQPDRARLDAEAKAVAAAWLEALATVEPSPFAIRAGSDFGKLELAAAGGTRPHVAPWDPAWMTAAEDAAARARTDEDAARALRDLGATWWAAVFAGEQKRIDARYTRAAIPIWPAALRWYERTVDALPADAVAIPALAEQLATIALFPQDRKLYDQLHAHDWQGARFDQLTALSRRRSAAHPWW